MVGRRVLVLVLVMALAAGAAACGDDGAEEVGAGGTTAPTESPSTTAATDEPAEPFAGATTPTSVPSEAGATALLTDVRVAHHPGFDRIVFEFDGDGPPGVDTRYVDPPVREDGSGAEVEVAGEAFLQIRMEPAAAVELRGEEPVETYDGPDRFDPDVPAVAEVVEVGDFEANLTWAIGLTAKVEYRVVTLSAPARVVVDVRSAG